MRENNIKKQINDIEKIVTCAEMKRLEKAADDAGLSYYQMMENAGRSSVELLKHDRPDLAKGRIAVFCGKGNNGGDGFVAARVFAKLGADVTVILVEGEPKTPDAITNYRLIKNSAIPILEEIPGGIAADLIVDSIYGTGFQGSLRVEGRKAIDLINASSAYVLSLDLPSGLPGDIEADSAIGKCVKADMTITFHAQKQIHQNVAAKKIMGKVITADIGISEILSE